MSEGGRAAMARGHSALVVLLCALRATTPARFPEVLPLQGWFEGQDAGEAEMQLVYLPALLPREAQSAGDADDRDVPLPYKFDAFGRSFDLRLLPNRGLVSPQFAVWSENGEEAPLDHALHGLIVTDNSTYEVRPLPHGAGRAQDGGGRRAHVIRRASPPPVSAGDAQYIRPRVRRPRQPRVHANLPSKYTIEIALFLDEAGYKLFHPFLNHNEGDLRDMLLAYINGVQALYHHASLGTRIQLSLVRLTLLRSQPSELPPYAERGRLLDSFCAYQKSLNVDDDDDPQHWDMALLLSGLDFYSEEGGRRNGVTMGLAPVGGVCLPAHACVVSEFGASDLLGRPYPSAGFTSVYILAHEIGHNLGMHHDGTGNACARDGYIMSPSRGTHGEASWSRCSAKVAADLQWATCLLDGSDDDEDIPEQLHHERFGGAPGIVWDAKKQCEVLLRDVDAAPVEESGSGGRGGGSAAQCAQLTCRSPHRLGFYYAGPALPGTPCGLRKWCQGGECVAAEQSPEADSQVPGGAAGAGGAVGAGGWGAWRAGACRSGCTVRARGALERRRTCSTGGVCEGAAYEVTLCDDTKVCGKKRRVSANEYAARRCAEYAARLPALDARGGGLQAPHDQSRMWMGCAIFCRRAAGGGFYAPRVELNAAGLDPYFPDGTWCHNDGSNDYFCQQHHCLPEVSVANCATDLVVFDGLRVNCSLLDCGVFSHQIAPNPIVVRHPHVSSRALFNHRGHKHYRSQITRYSVRAHTDKRLQ
ncbi:A disintegrin and metalloproteinase with thrombospondin motifs 3 [Papilio xuthus]|uniref:A disintegrin and metalloproteinase with thrombospondin motifs 3 n=1 Tax=Papilio xuthus TaxID=66420 RepID=A0A194PMV9_PAPXU|nr:A disintegrin and metalloproteinase with thrombospondin motifs 3 [Papilio xuthus]